MSQPPVDTANFCYRHPDRQSFVLCQRCGRTICSQCQTPAAVGVHCPECVREARASAPRTKPALLTRVRGASRRGVPVVTYSIIGVSLVIWLLQQVTGGAVTNALLFYAPFALSEPWRIVTSLFVHGSFFHIAFNMYALFIFGGEMERQLGRARFAALYFVGGIGGSAAVAVIAPQSPVVGASGAIFGLMVAFFIIARSLGRNAVQLLVLVAINLAIGFVLPGVAWQAHVGGIIAGAAVAWVFTKTRHRSKKPIQIGAIAAIGVVLIAITLVRSAQILGLA
ncbi:rhomboid family intramembrane serine protease [Frigoribacterium sp. 2-23]|uniref:rhomboid family intramembrane serine protease n=1 Tax=Frigoribacterium sp. 2-23 TaxID=3415006 RepID=UPI003C6FA86A